MSEHEKEKTMEEYSIPFIQHSGMTMKFKLLYGFFIILCGACAFVPVGEGIGYIAYKALFLALTLLFLYGLIYVGVFKKQYVELTEKRIVLKSAFGKKTLEWNEVFDIQIYTMNNYVNIGIISKGKMKKRKNSFWTFINDMFAGNYSMAIGMIAFPDIDLDRLYFTMTNMLVRINEKADGQVNDNEDCSHDFNESKDEASSGSLFVALVKIFWLSIALGLVYGLSIDILKVDFIIIPVFGTMGIIYTYLKSYKEERINFIVRIIVGLISALQVFVAAITELFIYNKLELNIENITNLTQWYYDRLISNPDKGQFTMAVMAIFCFGYGAFQGHKFKFQRKFDKVLMKKAGKHYYKKESRFMTIYLKDPASIDEDAEGRLVSQINSDCFIEKKKKKVTAFYIPVSLMEEIGVHLGAGEDVDINDISYHKIDLGGQGVYQPYVFPCLIYMNAEKQAEEIHIQI